MENLSLKLEQLLGDFVADFLNKMVAAEEYQVNHRLPESFRIRYGHYLEQFRVLKTQIENYTATSQEETRQRNRALILLKSSSESIISTFHLGSL
jgi:hypothetical protein